MGIVLSTGFYLHVVYKDLLKFWLRKECVCVHYIVKPKFWPSVSLARYKQETYNGWKIPIQQETQL